VNFVVDVVKEASKVVKCNCTAGVYIIIVVIFLYYSAAKRNAGRGLRLGRAMVADTAAIRSAERRADGAKL